MLPLWKTYSYASIGPSTRTLLIDIRKLSCNCPSARTTAWGLDKAYRLDSAAGTDADGWGRRQVDFAIKRGMLHGALGTRSVRWSR
jgi:hypothetical protein